MKASECRCCICGKPAVAFWPIIDPDIPSHPYCRKCLDKTKRGVIIELLKMDKKKQIIMEDFVTYEQAVRLKELGFNWGCTHNYNEDGVLETHTDFVSGEGGVDYKISVEDFKYSVNNSLLYKNIFDAPTLAQATKWLREVHNLHIQIECVIGKKWTYTLVDMQPQCDINGEWYDRIPNREGYPIFDTYESALSTGIDTTLKLIDNKTL